MFENIAAAHRWAIDKGAARTKVTLPKSRSQVYSPYVPKIVLCVPKSKKSLAEQGPPGG